VGIIQNDFNYHILEQVEHRPWPTPESPWIMTQTWHDLLFAHWPLHAEVLARKVPPPLELELFNGRAWLGIVPFHMTNVAPRAVPALPWVSAFPELNVRTYVRVGTKPGVYFFSLDAGNPLAAGVARMLFDLPYYTASMKVEQRNGSVHYTSRRTSANSAEAEFIGSYQPSGPVFQAAKGSLEYFLSERYCLYTVGENGHTHRLEIHHPPWPLQPARAQIDVVTMTDGLGFPLPSATPVLHFAKRQDVVAWAMTRVD
jgi:uncharacterized protein YqjF (DUF2071 family)